MTSHEPDPKSIENAHTVAAAFEVVFQRAWSRAMETSAPAESVVDATGSIICTMIEEGLLCPGEGDEEEDDED